MNKIKDLIYEYNDVFVALLIVAIAAGVITWRVDKVMAYSDYVSANASQREEIDDDFTNVDLNKEPVENIVDPTEDPETTGPAVTDPKEDPKTEDPKTEDPKTEDPVVEDPTPQVKTYTLTVSKENGNTTWGTVGKWLEDKGLVTSSKDFVNRVVERKVEARLQLGTFEFKSGMTLDEVIDLIIK